LSRIFAERHKTGGTDLEAIEMALRVALHQVGASALTALLQYEVPDQDHRQLPCPCGHTAPYLGLRAKTLVTALGPAELRRPYHLCARCGEAIALTKAEESCTQGDRRSRPDVPLHTIVSARWVAGKLFLSK